MQDVVPLVNEGARRQLKRIHWARVKWHFMSAIERVAYVYAIGLLALIVAYTIVMLWEAFRR